EPGVRRAGAQPLGRRGRASHPGNTVQWQRGGVMTRNNRNTGEAPEGRSRGNRIFHVVALLLLAPLFIAAVAAVAIPWFIEWRNADAPLVASSGEPADEVPELTPRETYSKGVELLMAQDLDGAETQFEDARERAAQDAELRYRAAFNLAMTHV